MDAGEGRSSSNDLSSAPNSDIEGPDQHSIHPATFAATSRLANDASAIIVPGVNPVGVANGSGGSAPPTTASDARQDTTHPKTRKPRRKKDPADPQITSTEKKPRKPRSAAGPVTTSRKKAKVENADNRADIKACTPLQEEAAAAKPPSLSTSLLNSAPTSGEASANAPAKLTQFGFTREDQENIFQRPAEVSKPPDLSRVSPPRSTSMYDPIRSRTVERPTSVSRPAPISSIPHISQIPQPVFRPSASNAISSIIDPPAPHAYPGSSPITARTRSDEVKEKVSDAVPAKVPPVTMDVDTPSSAQIALTKPSLGKHSSSDGPSTVPSPKPTRAKEQPPPVPQGSGLLSSSLFGAESKDEGQSSEKGPNIILHVDLKGRNNQVINFARMAEEKYGFAALYPRQAAQKERLARVAAAGAALERSASNSKLGGSAAESGDEDVSVDIDRDSDNDGDVMMSGLNGGLETGANSGTDGPLPKRRRRKKMEEYDQEDPFVDDSELIWEAQAAASKDGFFVYCGPLVPEGEKPAVERADGTVKRGRGRGRGGGVGSRGGRGAASAGTNAETGPSRGGGPGSRGGNVTRKPRMTKADRAIMEKEKANREKMAPLAAKPVSYPS